MTGLVASLLTLTLVGVLLDRGLLGAPGRGLVETLGRGLMLGIGGVGCLSLLLDVTGLGVTFGTVAGGCALLVLGLGALAWRGVPGRARPADEATPGWRELSGMARLAVLLLVALTLLGLAQAVVSGWVRPTWQFDAIVRWMFKTKVLYFEGSLLGALSHHETYGFTHQRYPPLVSHVAVFPLLVERALGPERFLDRIASAMYPWYAVACVAVLFGFLRRRVGLLTACLGAAWVANLPLVAFITAPPPGAGAASAMADVPLSLFVLGAALAAADAVDGRRVRGCVEAGLLLGFAALTKNEGLPLLAGVGLGLLLSLPRARIKIVAGTCGLGLAIFLAAWGLVMLGFPALDEDYLGQLHGDAIRGGVDRLGIILLGDGGRLGLLQELVNLRSWNLTWPAVAVLLGLGFGQLRKRGPRLLLTVLLVQLASYVFAYSITRWTSPAAELETGGGDPLPYLMSLTLGRLLLQVAPLAVATALLVAPLLLATPAPRPSDREPLAAPDGSG